MVSMYYLSRVPLPIPVSYFSIICLVLYIFFFFQAEDGIRDVAVTGVQTCALPILRVQRARRRDGAVLLLDRGRLRRVRAARARPGPRAVLPAVDRARRAAPARMGDRKSVV